MQTPSRKRCGKKPDAFLYSIILRQDSDLPLTVLSLLARQDIDPWQEAASYARLPRAAAATELSARLGKIVPNNFVGDELRAEAYRLLDLLPRPDAIDALSNNWMWPVLQRLFERFKYVAEIWKSDHRG